MGACRSEVTAPPRRWAKNLEGVEKPALPSAGRPKIVLDGQQQLTSLWKEGETWPEAERTELAWTLACKAIGDIVGMREHSDKARAMLGRTGPGMHRPRK